MKSVSLSVFSGFLKKKLGERGWSVKEFSKVAELSEKYCYRLVSVKRDFVPGDETVGKIIKALGLDGAEGEYMRELALFERKCGGPVFPGQDGLPVPPGSSDGPELPVSPEVTVRLSVESFEKLKVYADKEGVSPGDAARRIIEEFLLSLGGSVPAPAPESEKELVERIVKLEDKVGALRALVMGMGGKLQDTSERVELVMGAIGMNLPDYSK